MQRKHIDFKRNHRRFHICVNRADIKLFFPKAEAWPMDVVFCVPQWYFSNRVHTTKHTTTMVKLLMLLGMSCAIIQLIRRAQSRTDDATAPVSDPNEKIWIYPPTAIGPLNCLAALDIIAVINIVNY